MSHAPHRKKRATGKQAKGGLIAAKGNRASLTQIVEARMPMFPPKTTKLLRYSDSATLTSTAGAMATLVLSATDAFQPPTAGGGHQPMGFDQMCVFYQTFCVLKCKLIATFRNTSAFTGSVHIRYDSSVTPLTVASRIIEIGGGCLEDLEVVGTLGSNKRIELSLNAAKLRGLTPRTLLAETSALGGVSASPANILYWHLGLYDTAGNTVTCRIDYIMDMLVAFIDPRDITQS